MNNPTKQISLDVRLARLRDRITELKEKESLAALQALLDAGTDPKVLLACCMEAMNRIGKRFEKGIYFISALIMAGEIMRSATDLLSPHLSKEQSQGTGGRFLLGTIKGDIHDLGKNLFGFLLKCHGIDVIDIGVDVNAQTFLEEAQRRKPDMIGISCVLTNSIDNLKEAVTLLQNQMPTPKIPIIVGGTCLDTRVAEHVGAGLWAHDASTGLVICRQNLKEGV